MNLQAIASRRLRCRHPGDTRRYPGLAVIREQAKRISRG